MNILPIEILITGVVFGAILGTFLNVLITWQTGWSLDIFHLRSVCYFCERRIAWHHNIPILSWLLLHGRSHCCGTSISIRYPIVEVLAVGLTLLLLVAPPSGRSIYDDHFSILGILSFLFNLFFLGMLLVIAFSDLEAQGHNVPQFATDAGIIAGCLGGLLIPGLAGRFHIPWLPYILDSFLYSLAGSVFGLGLTQIWRLFGKVVFKREGFGFGAVMTMGVIGSFMGWKNAMVVFFIAPFFGMIGLPIVQYLTAIWKSPVREVSYPVYLTISVITVMCFRNQLSKYVSNLWQHSQQPSYVWALLTMVLWSLMIYLAYTVVKERFQVSEEEQRKNYQ